MKKRLVMMLLAVCVTVAGCGQADGSKSSQSVVVDEKEEFQIELESKIEQEDCFLCGDAEDSLMGYYSKKESIGIVHLNSLHVSESRVRDFDDDGNELFQQGGSSIMRNSFGDGYGSVAIHGNPDRGYSNIDVSVSDKDEVDFDLLEDRLCQTCLDTLGDFYEDQMNYGDSENNGCSGYCLIDFQTKELYRLTEPYSGYTIGDYYVQYDIWKEGGDSDWHRISVFIAYLPERVPSASE